MKYSKNTEKSSSNACNFCYQPSPLAKLQIPTIYPRCSNTLCNTPLSLAHYIKPRLQVHPHHHTLHSYVRSYVLSGHYKNHLLHKVSLNSVGKFEARFISGNISDFLFYRKQLKYAYEKLI